MYTVLTIGIEPSELNILSSIANQDGSDLRIVGSLADSYQALSFLDKNYVDILIMSIHLPSMTGIELLQEIRNRNLNVRCIFVASPIDCSYVQKAIPLEIENFLLTPVDQQIFAETLRNTIGKINQGYTQKTRASIPLFPEPISYSAHSFTSSFSSHTFENLMLNQEYKQCLAYLDSLFSHDSLTVLPPATLRNHVVELVVYTINILRSYNIDLRNTVDDTNELFYNILHFQNMEDLYFWMRDFLSNAIEALENENLPYSPCIARVVAHVEKNYTQDISIKTIACDLNINAAYLGQLFKSETGQLFSAFLNKTRIENAQKLLLNTRLSLNEISQQCGYTNISYFYNIFKKFTGKTPTQYRNTKQTV